jgi:DNA-binding winged helix-turn-helix (wHTH) protein
MRVQFGDCTLDLETRELLRAGGAVHVEPKALRLLEVLVRARPRALSKDELQSELWPKTFVSERSLARLVVVLRNLMADDAREPRYIRTVHGFGYAFCGEACELPRRSRPAGSAAQCRLIWGDREIALRDGENILGRDPEATAWIDRNSVSRRHARIAVSGGRAVIEDMGSKNGTFVSGKRIGQPTPLSSGDEVTLGSASLVFRVFRANRTTASKVTR